MIQKKCEIYDKIGDIPNISLLIVIFIVNYSKHIS